MKLQICRGVLSPSHGASAIFYRTVSSIKSTEQADGNLKETSSSSSDQSQTEFIDIKEGKASMKYAKNKAVFYNKVQIFNRDISILVLRHFAEFRQAEQQMKYEDRMQRFTGLNEMEPKHHSVSIILTYELRLLLSPSIPSQTTRFYA